MFCNICKKTSESFRKYGTRKGAKCPNCGSLERHRLAWIAMDKVGILTDTNNKTILHVAPESCLIDPLVEHFGTGYLSMDLAPGAMIQADLTGLPFEDNKFDFLFCSHVLEHIDDDVKALREIHRVTKGHAIITVPISVENTEENQSIITAEDRLKIYGHPDHRRNYGKDFSMLLSAVGYFFVEAKPSDFGGKKFRQERGIDKDSLGVFICWKE